MRFVPQSCIESQDAMWQFFFAIGFDSDNIFVALSSYYYNDFWFNLAGNPYYREAQLHRIRSLVRRSRNHPSILVWSMGNEAGQV